MDSMNPTRLFEMRSIFGDRMQENVPLSGYTAARIGGPADVLVFIHSADELMQAAGKLWEMEEPFILLGGGSNVLVSDRGVRGVVIINRSKLLRFNSQLEPPTVYAESGVSPNDIAQRAARLGLAGFEWAASIPGSLGGAVYGNAGAFDGEMSRNVISVDVFHRQYGCQTWPLDKMEYGYRTSRLKREHLPVVILSAKLLLSHGIQQDIKNKMEQFSSEGEPPSHLAQVWVRCSENPPGDKAGRLIEAAG